MLVSLDGRVAGDYLEQPTCQPFIEDYGRILADYQAQAWICGRTAFEEGLGSRSPLDSSGKLTWTKGRIGDEYQERKGDLVVTVLSERVADAYLAYLRSIGVSYIFAGKTRDLDPVQLLDKLHQYFGLTDLYLLGGGVIDGVFAQAETIDRISLVMAPLVEGTRSSRSLFDFGDTAYSLQSQYHLSQCQPLDSGGLHLVYQKYSGEKS